MKKVIDLFKKRDGYTLIVIIVILLVISLMFGLTLTLNFTSRARSLQFDTYRVQALYMAEAGIREVIWYLKYGQTQPPSFIEFDFENWKGRAEMTIQVNSPQQGETTITSIGKVPYNTQLEVQRVIKVIIDNTTHKTLKWEEITLEYIK